MMTPEEFNSWACDVANDYEQARREMGPDDYETWEQYSFRRMEECDEAWHYVMSQPDDNYTPMDSNDLRELRDPVRDYDITNLKTHDTTCDDDELPF